MRRGAAGNRTEIGGLAVWLLDWWRGRRRGRRCTGPRLALVEKINLAPRQSLALVEAEGRRILVATSAEGGPAFYPLDERTRHGARPAARAASRVSW